VLADPSLVPQAVAAALGVSEQPRRTLSDTLLDFLREKELLIVLDNCEHVLDACAQLVTHWLQQAVGLKVLATSREALNIEGEIAWLVPSLQLPDDNHRLPSADLQCCDAIRLFVERASAVRSDFQLTDQNAAAVAQICRRLDGMPLAIELAAALVHVLSVEQIAVRLDDALLLLNTGRRSAPARHQTLRATLDWSYHLLSDAEQRLFRRLGVFAGGFTLEAAEATCTDAGLEDRQILSQLASLANKSLLVAQDIEAQRRFRLLEPIRQYAREKLREAGEETRTRDRQLVFVHAFALATLPRLQTPEQLTYLADLERELDNVRAALTWAVETKPVLALDIVSALFMLWNVRGYTTEGRRWGQAALDRTEGDSSPDALRARAQALSTVAYLTLTQGDNLAASQLIAQAVEWFRAVQDLSGLARALFVQASAYSFLGEASLARIAAEESLSITTELADETALGRSLGIMAAIMFQLGDMAASRRYAEEGMQYIRQSGAPIPLAISYWGMTMGAFQAGDLATARRYGEASLALFRQIGDKHRINMALSGLADMLRRQSEYRAAAAMYQEAIQGWRAYGQQGGIARCLECLAFIAIANEDETKAARWLGAAEALREAAGARMIPREQAEYEQEVKALRAGMQKDDLDRLWADGRRLTMAQVIAEVGGLSLSEQAKTQDPNALTARELEVLRLVAAGLTDTRIAERLVISPRTVNKHLTTIYSKLGVNSRTAATRYALDHKLL
jgi:predicted ATPase/DNA-binding CsgD family transcriptional regulator